MENKELRENLELSEMLEEEVYEMIDDENTTHYQTSFIVDSIDKANWVIDKIKQEEKSLEFFIKSTEAEINRLKLTLEKEKQKIENNTGYLKSLLKDYIETEDVPLKMAKTSASVKLATGKIVKKFEQKKIVSNTEKEVKKDNDLIEYCETSHPELVKISKTVDWSKLKKEFEIKTIMDKDVVVDLSNGEILDFMGVETVPEKIEIK